jgi:hypothetical protein
MVTGAIHGGGISDRAAQLGLGLEVANTIREYLGRAGGDARLALALAVAEAFDAAPERRASWSRPSLPVTHARA